MSYLNPQLGATIEDATPGSATDFSRTWSNVKNEMRASLGEYKFADGTPRTVSDGFNNLRSPPMMARQHAIILHDWAIRVAAKMKAQANSKGRPTGDIDSAVSRYESRYRAALAASMSVGMTTRLTLDQCHPFILALDHFAVELSTAQWTAYNIGTRRELFDQALSETPGGGIIKGLMFAGGVFGGLVSNLDLVLKIAFFGGLGYLSYRAYRGLSQ